MTAEERPHTSARRPRSVEWVFLDRDGTLNVKAAAGEYVERPDELRLLPGAAQAVRSLNRAGIWVGVVTNQRGVALGRMSAEDLAAVHDRLALLLAREGAFIDAIYACPHEDGECECRKPRPGLLLQAQREHTPIEFGRAAIVGDSLSDVEAGRRLGLATVQIVDPATAACPDGGGVSGARAARPLADHLAPDLLSATRWLIGESER